MTLLDFTELRVKLKLTLIYLRFPRSRHFQLGSADLLLPDLH